MMSTKLSIVAPAFVLIFLVKVSSAGAADINWVGYQFGPPGGLSNPWGYASFFHGDNWLGYNVPVSDDNAIFDTDVDPQNNEMPTSIYFGDVTLPVIPIYHPVSETIPADDGVINRLFVQKGVFDFYFTDYGLTTTPRGSLTVNDYIVIGGLRPGGPLVTSAALTVHGIGLIQGPVTPGNGVVVGNSFGADGHLIIDGIGTNVTVNDVRIGNFGGTGELKVINGAKLTARSIIGGTKYGSGPLGLGNILVDGVGSTIVGLNQVNNGSISIINGGTADALHSFTYIGVDSGTSATATVSGPGSTWSNIDALFVGGVYHTDTTGHGVLNVLGGGSVAANSITIGEHSSTTGEVQVSGSNSTLVTSGIGKVGTRGHGSLSVSDHGMVVSNGANVGDSAGSVGAVTVDDHAIWNNSGVLTIGLHGNGGFHATSQSSVTSTSGTIGSAADGTGNATFSGSGTSWTLGGDLTIGDSGAGSLSVVDHAIASLASSSVLRVGRNSTGVGALSIDSAAALAVGRGEIGLSGSGTATISHGAQLTLSSRLDVGVHGILDLSNDGIVTIGPGSLPANGTLQVGTGGLFYAYNGGRASSKSGLLIGTTASIATATVSAASTVWDVSDELTIGDNSGASGVTALLHVPSGGLVTVGHSLKILKTGAVNVFTGGGGKIEIGNIGTHAAAGAIRIGSGGSLNGSGSITGSVVNEGGMVSPGSSPGLLNISGDFTQLNGASMSLEISGLSMTQYDRLQISGNLTLGGDVPISLVGGYVPNIGDRFDLFAISGSANVSANALRFANAPAALSLRSGYSSGVYSITVIPTLAGDYDGNGRVENADLVVWRSSFGSHSIAPDGNGDGNVDGADYVVWRKHLGQSVGSGSSTATNVPEPDFMVCWAIVAICFCSAQRGGTKLWGRISRSSDLEAQSRARGVLAYPAFVGPTQKDRSIPRSNQPLNGA